MIGVQMMVERMCGSGRGMIRGGGRRRAEEEEEEEEEEGGASLGEDPLSKVQRCKDNDEWHRGGASWLGDALTVGA